MSTHKHASWRAVTNQVSSSCLDLIRGRYVITPATRGRVRRCLERTRDRCQRDEISRCLTSYSALSQGARGSSAPSRTARRPTAFETCGAGVANENSGSYTKTSHALPVRVVRDSRSSRRPRRPRRARARSDVARMWRCRCRDRVATVNEPAATRDRTDFEIAVSARIFRMSLVAETASAFKIQSAKILHGFHAVSHFLELKKTCTHDR